VHLVALKIIYIQYNFYSRPVCVVSELKPKMNDENHCPVGTVNPFKTQMAWVHIL
jgi:hypothetical protein